MNNLLHYESDTQTANSVPVKYPSSQRVGEVQGHYSYGGSTMDNSHEQNAVIPLDNRGQIAFSKELNQ